MCNEVLKTSRRPTTNSEKRPHMVLTKDPQKLSWSYTNGNGGTSDIGWRKLLKTFNNSFNLYNQYENLGAEHYAYLGIRKSLPFFKCIFSSLAPALRVHGSAFAGFLQSPFHSLAGQSCDREIDQFSCSAFIYRPRL